ncbi:hypothetical protein Droror1_Dr00006371 [Drosera rotundifolia]
MSKYEQSHRQRSYRHHQNYSTREYSPSFSSSLLDAIYRSFDESSTDHHLRKNSHENEQKEESVFFERSAEKTRSCGRESKSSSRAQLIHQWIKKTAEKDILRRISTADHHSHEASKTSLKTDRRFEAPKLMNSSSRSSDSTAVFSSSSEPFHGPLKPIRTRLNHQQQQPQIRQFSDPRNHRDHTTVATVTKSKSMPKIDGNLKKSRQNPISPGAKLATFINSLFAAKKPKISSPPINESIKSEKDLKSPANSSSSTCSTASSLSRSCLSKTPSSAGRHEQQTGKRSVRFYPVNETVTEDSKRRSQEETMAVYVDDEFRVRMMEEGRRRIEEAARELLEKYRHQDDEDDEDEDEDDRSCCSSDLFELENLMEIGIERYREELPVYGTTRLDVGNGIVV